MKIRMLRNPAATIGCPLTEGQTGEVSDTLGAQLVGLGVAIDVTPAPPELVAVPAEAVALQSPAPSIGPRGRGGRRTVPIVETQPATPDLTRTIFPDPPAVTPEPEVTLTPEPDAPATPDLTPTE